MTLPAQGNVTTAWAPFIHCSQKTVSSCANYHFCSKMHFNLIKQCRHGSKFNICGGLSGLHCFIYSFYVSKVHESLLYYKRCQSPSQSRFVKDDYGVFYDHIEGSGTYFTLCKYHYKISGEQMQYFSKS